MLIYISSTRALVQLLSNLPGSQESIGRLSKEYTIKVNHSEEHNVGSPSRFPGLVDQNGGGFQSEVSELG
jgi:hypothetical protein